MHFDGPKPINFEIPPSIVKENLEVNFHKSETLQQLYKF